MKKLFCLLFLFIVCASGCVKQEVSDPFSALNGDFKATISVTCNGSVSECEIEYSNKNGEDEKFVLTVLSPEEAAGYVFAFDGENYKLSFNGISVDCNSQMSLYPMSVKTALSPDKEGIVSIGSEEFEEKDCSVVQTSDLKYVFDSEGKLVIVSGVSCGRTVEIKFNSFDVLSDGEK